MPRFSDVFMWARTSEPSRGIVVFTNCILIKSVGEFQAGTHIDSIVFDVLGMCLMFRENVYCLTVAS